ncbi:MAG: acetylglucosamine transferase, partial [Chthoniobacteraceae bacterium]
QYGHREIRLAYLSSDFREHAVGSAIAELIERHDKTKFHTIGISYRAAPESDLQARLRRNFGTFIDVQGMSDFEVATLLREREVDVAVDLNGHTNGGRPGIFALRPAPVQVNYLGFSGTTGADYMDYVLADRIVIPEEHESYYSEKIVRLPDAYLPLDSTRTFAARAPTRAEMGLPEAGFVFCAFNTSFKISPDVFSIWMRLLGKVQGSVLWLNASNAPAPRNLRGEAKRRGIAPERLVFASKMRLDEHLARHQQADLFLDTLPYNAHTTASDALWAGLPVLTCMGSTFAGRVAASLLHTVGLPELVTHSPEEYEQRALELATMPTLLAGVRTKLARNRTSHALFDTDRFRRHVESAYVTMWEKQQRGDPPAGFAVEPVERSSLHQP